MKGFPGLTAKRIAKHVGMEYAIEVGHLRALPKGVRSTTTKSSRGRPRTKIEEQIAATEDTTATPVQKLSNKKTHKVFMTVRLADDWITSDQTRAFPRTSSKGNKDISVFYMHDPNFIKGVPIKSRHADQLSRAYRKYVVGVKPVEFNLSSTEWTMKPPRKLRISLRANRTPDYNT